VQRLLLQVKIEAVQDEVLQTVEYVLLYQPQVTRQLLVVDELLDLVVETDPLDRVSPTKFL
jgi:hypothetical protein